SVSKIPTLSRRFPTSPHGPLSCAMAIPQERNGLRPLPQHLLTMAVQHPSLLAPALGIPGRGAKSRNASSASFAHRMVNKPSLRRQRFVRSGAKPLRLTADDVAVIEHLARHRFLRSTHLMQLFPHRAPKKLIERLGELYHAGYIDRPRAQIDYYQ